MNFLPINFKDSADVVELFKCVFADAATADEGLLIGKLVAEMIDTTPADDIQGYVATDNNDLLAAVLINRLSFASGINAYILSPMAVATAQQGKGIGQQLIQHGLQALTKQGVEWLFTYGDPSFYGKVGFQQINETIAQAPQPLTQPEGWLCQSLQGKDVQPGFGKARSVAALDKAIYW